MPRSPARKDIAVEYRALGRTGLKVSLLGLGTGGLDPLGIKSGRPEEEMRRLIWHAFDLGINLFDTSPGYGDGRSERILGDALRDLRPHRGSDRELTRQRKPR